MIRETLPLVAAPVAGQPGGYVRAAYAEETHPRTSEVELEVERGAGFSITLRWKAPAPARGEPRAPDAFVDACALLSAEHSSAVLVTMGAPGAAVTGALWRADRARPLAIRAEGMGSVVRREPSSAWRVEAAWTGGVWQVRFELDAWPSLERTGMLAAAVWQGAAGQRGGLKSVTESWLHLDRGGRP